MRLFLILVSAVALIGSAFLLTNATQADPPPVARINESEGLLMRSKLTYSQSVLEGLLRRDYRAIQRGAVEMRHISEAAEWPRPRDTIYEHFSAEFRRQCRQLEELAEKQNHQAAAFTYLQLTSLCITCHDHVRDSVRVAKEPGRPATTLIPSQWPE
ncbi:hypothetical protein [Stieleria varia]|uniref:Cytochrome C n=1 Tax=Stieleria varia TaxID=2528005 RepID=A0A5C6ASU0_9BACT|nr:hypothetical protein [Stieleria varia]TWU02136.1 hypothetical protein Pla52n_31850 [Stieleria varia]